jgi:hypothetical protein
MKFGVSLHWGVYSVPAFSDPFGSQFAAEWQEAEVVFPCFVADMCRMYRFWNYAGGPEGPNSSPAGQFWQRVYGQGTAGFWHA